MQTFLPHPSFMDSAEALDSRRLGKQRIEAKQILRVLMGESKGYAHHPAVRAWAGYEQGLAVYGLYVCSAWRGRGFIDNQWPYFTEMRLRLRTHRNRYTKFPEWTKNPEVHEAYRELLIWKDPDHYNPLFPEVDEPFERPDFPWHLLVN